MNILHIVPFYGEQHGGSERFAGQLAYYQARNKHNVIIVTTTRYRKNAKKIIVNEHLQIIKSFAPITLWNINPVAFIIPILRNLNPQIIHIHSHLYFISLQSLFYGYFKKKVTILHLHGGVGFPPFDPGLVKYFTKISFDKIFTKSFIKLATKIVSVSRRDLLVINKISNINKLKLEYIPNGINLNKFLYNSEFNINKKLNVIYIGDLEIWKGVQLIIDLIESDIRDLKEHFIFQFIGNGILFPKLKKLSIDYPENIIVHGQVSHTMVPNFLKNGNIFLFPSLWEGLPTVILEAMAVGIPIISSPVGDIPFLIQDGVNGLIIGKKHSNIKECLFHLKNNPELFIKFREYNKKLIKNYDFDLIMKKLDNLYYNALRSQNSSYVDKQ